MIKFLPSLKLHRIMRTKIPLGAICASLGLALASTMGYAAPINFSMSTSQPGVSGALVIDSPNTNAVRYDFSDFASWTLQVPEGYENLDVLDLIANASTSQGQILGIEKVGEQWFFDIPNNEYTAAIYDDNFALNSITFVSLESPTDNPSPAMQDPSGSFVYSNREYDPGWSFSGEFVLTKEGQPLQCQYPQDCGIEECYNQNPQQCAPSCNNYPADCSVPGCGDDPRCVVWDPNTVSTVTAIDNSCGKGGSNQFQKDCAAWQAASPEDRIKSSQRLTPDQVTAASLNSSKSTGQQANNLASRLSALRAGTTGLSFQGLTLNRPEDDSLNGIAAHHSPAFTGGAASADDAIFANERIGIFINGNVGWGDRDQTINEPNGYDLDSYSVTAGVDYRFLDNFIAGIALGYNSIRTDFGLNGGKIDTDGYTISGYGTYYYGEHLYIDGILSWGTHQNDQKRGINYQLGGQAISQTASADYDDRYWFGSIGGGYEMTNGSASFGPEARLDYLTASVDGYTESMSRPNEDGGGWAISTQNYDQDSLTSYIGGKFAYALSTENGVFMPQIKLGWIHQFKDSATVVDGYFVEGSPSDLFSIRSDRRDSDYYIASLGVSAQFAGGVSGFLQYSKLLGYKELSLDNIGAGLRISF